MSLSFKEFRYPDIGEIWLNLLLDPDEIRTLFIYHEEDAIRDMMPSNCRIDWPGIKWRVEGFTVMDGIDVVVGKMKVPYYCEGDYISEVGPFESAFRIYVPDTRRIRQGWQNLRGMYAMRR